MVWIVETKVFRHVIDRDRQFVELPVRVRFEYGVADGAFEQGTIEYTTLYNEASLLRRFPQITSDELAAEVDVTVRRALDEELRFAGLLDHGVSLFDAVDEVDATRRDEPRPDIIMPHARSR